MADRQLAPIEAVRSAGTAKGAKRLRGVNPRGVITVRFSVEAAFRALSIAACKKDRRRDWDGKFYPIWRRSPPHQQTLDDHSDVIVPLIGLARNGYPNSSHLREVLLHLHAFYNIFPAAS